ncbi:hypothetical protein [Novosphingobium colocasiae]|uniref:hypothetical protein n=1 Tax=Novosphingobium colocasiae TaxID=1256513 RepID=UPI0035B0AB12
MISDHDAASNVHRIHQDRIEIVRRDLKGPGGGDTSDGMEARVAKLEDKVDKLTDRIGGVEVNLATLTERIAHLPSKSYIDGRLLVLLTVVAALIAFSEKIHAFLR